jgi:UDP-N-acetylglucosamine acyltransferase
MMMIHPTCQIEPQAVIGQDVSIGPYCVIGPNVAIGDGCKLQAHVHVSGHTTIGPRTNIYSFAALGAAPQSTSYRGGPTRLVIGADCTIRESVTMNVGTEEGGGVTQVGDRGFFMAYCHVGHDCHVGNDVIFANSAMLGGHCVVGAHVFIGAMAGAHQQTRIGPHAMIAGMSGLRGDVIPYGMAAGAFARLSGVNVIGMKRRKFPGDTIRAVRAAYRLLFFGEGLLAHRLDAVEGKLGSDAAVAEVVAFVRETRHRPLCRPGGQARNSGADS